MNDQEPCWFCKRMINTRSSVYFIELIGVQNRGGRFERHVKEQHIGVAHHSCMDSKKEVV